MERTKPFPVFVNHSEKGLIEAVRKGRKAEFADFHAEGEAPDPQATSTFENSKLNWDLLDKGQHKVMLEYYKNLIQLRKNQSAFKHTNRKNMSVAVDEVNNTLIIQRWTNGQQVICLLNFSKQQQQVNIPEEITNWQKCWIAQIRNGTGQ